MDLLKWLGLSIDHAGQHAATGQRGQHAGTSGKHSKKAAKQGKDKK